MSDQSYSRETKLGALSAAAAYTLWGVFPLFFKLLGDVSVYVVIAHRVVWSAVFVALFLYLMKRLGEIAPVLKSRRSLLLLIGSTATITVNWTVFVWAIDNNQVLSVSFGYFMNPLVNIAIGMILLGERQNKLQTIAIAIAAIAVGIQAYGVGGFPWVSIVLATSFAFYGYFRKTVEVGAAPGLLIETTILVPFAIAFLFWMGPTTPVPSADASWGLWALLFMCGPATAIPLILFSIGARRLRMTTIGIFQYIAPSIQFIIAITLLGEELNQTRLLSFALIWVSLFIFTYDSVATSSQKSKVVKNAKGTSAEA